MSKPLKYNDALNRANKLGKEALSSDEVKQYLIQIDELNLDNNLDNNLDDNLNKALDLAIAIKESYLKDLESTTIIRTYLEEDKMGIVNKKYHDWPQAMINLGESILGSDNPVLSAAKDNFEVNQLNFENAKNITDEFQNKLKPSLSPGSGRSTPLDDYEREEGITF